MCGLHAGHFDGGQGPRDCLYRCSMGTLQFEPLGAQPSQEGTQPHSPSQSHIQFICSLCPREKNYQGIAVSVAAHEREVYSGEANGLLEKLWRPLLKTRRSNRYGVCYKCGDLHTNLSRHKSGCDRTLPETIPPHSDGLSGEPFARNPATPSTPALQWKVPIKANSLHRANVCRGE